MSYTFEQAQAKLGTREQRKIGNNRWLSRGAYYWIDPVTGEAWIVDKDDPRGARRSIRFTLHRTDVVTIIEGDFYILATGGWMTVTTKAAINEVIPAYLCSHRGDWIVGWPTRSYVEFEEHIVLDRFGDPVDFTSYAEVA